MGHWENSPEEQGKWPESLKLAGEEVWFDWFEPRSPERGLGEVHRGYWDEEDVEVVKVGRLHVAIGRRWRRCVAGKGRAAALRLVRTKRRRGRSERGRERREEEWAEVNKFGPLNRQIQRQRF